MEHMSAVEVGLSGMDAPTNRKNPQQLLLLGTNFLVHSTFTVVSKGIFIQAIQVNFVTNLK